MDINNIKNEIAVLETKEKEIVAFLKENATPITIVPEFNSKFCSSRFKLYSGPMHCGCNNICSECKYFVSFIPSSYVSVQTPASMTYPVYNNPVIAPPIYQPQIVPSQCVITMPGWCLKKFDSGDDKDVCVVEKDGVCGESEENNSQRNN